MSNTNHLAIALNTLANNNAETTKKLLKAIKTILRCTVHPLSVNTEAMSSTTTVFCTLRQP